MAKQNRPPKPYPTFPLFAHSRGYWCKKIDRQQVSFGRWEEKGTPGYEGAWKAALKAYHEHCERVAQGRELEERPDEATAKLLVDGYLTHQHGRLERGDIRPAHFNDVKIACLRFRDVVGRDRTIGDLEVGGVPLIREWLAGLDNDFGWYAYNRHVQTVRAMFKWAEHPVEGVLRRPFRLVPLLVKRRELQRRREAKERVVERGEHCYTTAELWTMLHAGNVNHFAMGLLGYFCAYGNTDCSELTTEHVQFEPDSSLGLPAGWALLHFPRPKTEIERAAVVPPLVVDVLRVALALRPAAAKAKWAKRVFLTKNGLPYTRCKIHRRDDGVVEKVVQIDSVGLQHKHARARAGVCPTHGPMLNLRSVEGRCPDCHADGELVPLHPMRKLGFYTYRHTGITFASGTSTPDAIALFEGHAISGVRSRYVAHVEVPKLKPIADALLARLLTRSRSTPSTDGPAPDRQLPPAAAGGAATPAAA